ncbi:uncharacterized protein LOC143057864 [Mytilus galloprovincialis]|uniref:uncharacterized protein LOC143057864 n=1 Tax=Mytilus galloprovincialis TaxID=29158 RepID=UPI003F7CB898
MLDNTYNFLTRYELIVPYSNEPDPFGIFSLYVKTTRVHIELQNVTNIYQESFPCNFEYGYTSSTGKITETGIMETTIGGEENSKININDINDITTQQTSSKEIITTQELNSEEVITTQKQNSEDGRMTQRPNPQESTTTEEIFYEDTSTTRNHNSEKRTTTEEQTFEDKSTTKRPTSDEITTPQILESGERQTTQEINSEERITTQKPNYQSGSTTTQEPNSEDGSMNHVLIHSTTIELEGDGSVISVPCHCPQVRTPRTTTKNTTIEDLQKELIIDKKTFSSYKRSLICIKDFRSSTNTIGGFAIVILSVVFGILVLSDILLLFRS